MREVIVFVLVLERRGIFEDEDEDDYEHEFPLPRWQDFRSQQGQPPRDKRLFFPPLRRYAARVKTDDPEYCRLERLDEEARLEDRKHAHKMTREEWVEYFLNSPFRHCDWEVVESNGVPVREDE